MIRKTKSRIHTNRGNLFTGEDLKENIPKDVSIKITKKKIFSGQNRIYAVFRRTPETRRKMPISKINTGKFTWMHNKKIFAEFKVEKIFHAYVYSFIEPERLPEGRYVVIFRSDDNKIVEFTDFIVMPFSLGEKKIEQIILFALTENSPLSRQEINEKVFEGLK